jgi:hypothetical protein
MKRRPREISVFSTSAIDLFASAMGAFIIIALVLIVNTSKTPAKNDGAPPTPTPSPTPTPIPPEPAPTPPFPGFEVEVPLGIVVEWLDRGVDIDLHVTHGGKTVYYANSAARWGILTRDERQGLNPKNREIFFCPRFDREESTGTYQVYLAYYTGDGSPAPYQVSGKIVIFPGTPAETSTPFRASVRSNHKGSPEVEPESPSPVALEFEVLLPPGSRGARDRDFQVRIR